MSDDFQWGPLIAELERELGKRKLERPLARLAEFKAGYERQSRKLSGMARPPWTTEMLIELAAMFQLHPVANYYPVLPRDNRCPHCRADLSGREIATIRAALSDRALHGCKYCSGRWLVLKPQAGG